MGPTCQVTLTANDRTTLDAIDAVLSAFAKKIERTRKARVWDIWIGGRPIHVSVTDQPLAVDLAAGCNGPEDYVVLRRLASELAMALGGVASEPVK